MSDTIFGLSSGSLPSGVAIIRLSGPGVRMILEQMAGAMPPPREAAYRALRGPDGTVIDRGLVLFFPGPRSFTGEDTAELQVHGSRAVVRACLDRLRAFAGLRLAEAGEFTRRAFENGRLDLTAVEGLGDLIAAETEAQRRQAMATSEGSLRQLAEAWRDSLLDARALVEAALDFSDEEDVPGTTPEAAGEIAGDVRAAIVAALSGFRRAERIRNGFTVALMGPPNAGKSSLLNALTRREVAIVTDLPGTTRDLLEVHLDLDGYAVTVVDMAGLREAADRIEAEGIRRGQARAASSDLILWLDEEGREPPADIVALGVEIWPIRTKADLAVRPLPGRASLSVMTGAGLDDLTARLGVHVAEALGREPVLVTQERQVRCLEDCVAALAAIGKAGTLPEIEAEHLRRATQALDRLVGKSDIEEILGRIFSRFCIGK